MPTQAQSLPLNCSPDNTGMSSPSVHPDGPFSLVHGPAKSLLYRAARLASAPVESVLGLRALNTLYGNSNCQGDSAAFPNRVLDLLGVSLSVSDHDIARIPATGRLLVVANHPFGAIEGIALAALLRSIRPDTKLMANYLLARIPELRPHLVQVDPFGGRAARNTNTGPLRQAVDWLRADNVLGVFPAGEVAHFRFRDRAVDDPPWSDTIGRIARLTECRAAVYFGGRNSLMFQLAGLINGKLRTALLPRELLNKTQRHLDIRIGATIPYRRLREFTSDSDRTHYLRLRTFLLAEKRPDGVKDAEALPRTRLAPEADTSSADAARLAAEINELPGDAMLVASGSYIAYCATAAQIPNCLREIGRLREVTFRAVGEGTGRDIDLDDYDKYYRHLFVWDTTRREIVGAYRLGLTDRIMRGHGLKGLYTRSLFKFSRRLIDEISPALELGRSFIRAEYQREYAPLHLLWQGIGQFVVRHPHYQTLFGPVSISGRYQTVSHQLIMQFLQNNGYTSGLSTLVKATNPPKQRGSRSVRHALRNGLVSTLDEVSSLVAEVENSEVGVPILLKHYLRLGGRLLGFNVDPNFNDALDGLIVVNLTETNRRILERYLGRAGAAAYLRHHGANVSHSVAGAFEIGLSAPTAMVTP
jgi:putative hemolysin